MRKSIKERNEDNKDTTTVLGTSKGWAVGKGSGLHAVWNGYRLDGADDDGQTAGLHGGGVRWGIDTAQRGTAGTCPLSAME